MPRGGDAGCRSPGGCRASGRPAPGWSVCQRSPAGPAADHGGRVRCGGRRVSRANAAAGSRHRRWRTPGSGVARRLGCHRRHHAATTEQRHRCRAKGKARGAPDRVRPSAMSRASSRSPQTAVVDSVPEKPATSSHSGRADSGNLVRAARRYRVNRNAAPGRRSVISASFSSINGAGSGRNLVRARSSAVKWIRIICNPLARCGHGGVAAPALTICAKSTWWIADATAAGAGGNHS